MPETTGFVIGANVSCGDGDCGTLGRVVIDPVAEAVTHLVVEPRHEPALARLVPVELARSDAGGIRLGCSLAQFQELEPAEETRFIPGPAGDPAYGEGQSLSWPYYSLGGSLGPLATSGLEAGPQAVTYDSVPPGEVAIRRGDHVHATDGDIGRVQGLVMDPGTRHVTHVLLQEGHLWGRKDVAIPISAVAATQDGIRLRISKAEVQGLPPVDLG